MRIRILLAFLVLTVGGGLLIGMVSAPDEWYQNLVKPVLNPPSWVFAPVWTFLYILISGGMKVEVLKYFIGLTQLELNIFIIIF